MDNLTTGEKLESSQDSSSITDLAVNNTQEPFTTEHVHHTNISSATTVKLGEPETIK